MSSAAIVAGPKSPVVVQTLELPPPGPGQVRVRMEACGVCHSDLMIAGLEVLPVLPLIVGHEGVGTVEALGEGVTQVRVGDRVGATYLATSCGSCELCRSGRERLCPKQTQHGYTQQGAMATHANLMAQHLARVPAKLSAEQAAPLCCAGWTAYGAVHGAGLAAGQSVGIFGMGGLGHLAVQYARHLGVEVAASDVSEAKLDQARSLGARWVAPAKDGGKALLKASGGLDAAIVFTSATAAIPEAFRSLKRGGTVYLVGMNAGARYELPLNETILKGLSVRGSFLGTADELREVFELALQGVGAAHVEPHALEDVPAIFDRLRAGEILGRAVVRFG